MYLQIIHYKLKKTSKKNDRLSRNSFSAAVFNKTKLEHEEALKKYGHPTNLSYTPLNREQNNARKKCKTSNHLV